MSLTKEDLNSAVKNAVADAMKGTEVPKADPISLLECPDCQSIFKNVPRYVDHRIGEYVDKKLADVQAPNPEKLLMDCKDGICKMLEEHVEATYDVTKKGEAPAEASEGEPPGLFDHHDAEVKAAEEEA